MSAAKVAAVEAYKSLVGCGVEAVMSLHKTAVAMPRPVGGGASGSEAARLAAETVCLLAISLLVRIALA